MAWRLSSVRIEIAIISASQGRRSVATLAVSMKPTIDPKNDELQSYDFELPRELIAQDPLPQRADARMMVIHREQQTIDHAHVRDLPSLLRAGDSVVVNDSKVIPARMIGYRTSTKGRWEGLYLRQDEHAVAETLCKTRGKIEVGETVTLRDREGRDQAKLVVLGMGEEGRLFLRPEPIEPWPELLARCGRIPLPPYIRDGQMVDDDRVRYQTVYARNDGSVAAPTAGLHFTPALIQQLRASGIALVSVTLHVGIGTFRPIQAKTLENHKMHSEVGELTEAVVKRLSLSRAEGGRIIAIGTTSVRVLETAALKSTSGLQAWSGETDIFIRPGHTFKAVDGLLTNFHLPRSSLMVLVATFAGLDLIHQAYAEAIRERYRFYSYGDCMLIL
ncbi:MAG: tRNA preQ1(34) S-adenosylmethionine ribosyltransferase-isomerase QueA [Pirellulaceae bacterium]|nr:tRNA preQ1(34) S-adenosylmethionine ribosyltransferase-isomerase QueA [Pirellulaceae bacterium]